MTEPLFADLERIKYERVWQHRQYREQNDGIPCVRRAFVQMGCKEGETLIDWGCGGGECVAAFQDMGLKAVGYDIAHNCIDPELVDLVPLTVGTLWDPPREFESDFGFCTDVLEHLPPDYVEQAVEAIAMRTLRAAYFQIDTVQDTSGDRMSPPMRLHLCVRPVEWWGELFNRFWPGGVLDEPGFYSRHRFICFK